jgi:trigger factor
VPNYKKAPVKFVTPAIPESEVDEHIERIREAFAKFDKADEGYAVQHDDVASIDFEGKINGQPIKEIAPEAAAIAEGTSHWAQANNQRFLPQLVSELIGMKAGESKTVEFTFEGDYLPDGLKNQPAVYSLAVKEVRRRVLPTDDEIVQQMKTESMDALRKMTHDNLTERAVQEALRKFESEILAHLIGKKEFDLPQSELDAEINETLHRMADDAGRRGMTKEDLEKHRADIIESATTMAKRQLRVRYLLSAIADEEKIEATDADVNQWIEEAAPEHRVTPIQLKARIEKNGRMEDLRAQVRNQKAMKMLVDSLK